MHPKTILITGGTGLVGQYLTNMLLAAGHEVIVLTRKPAHQPAKQGLSFAKWDVASGFIDAAAVAAADAVVHLAGAPVVAKPWTDAYKKEIVDSRVQSGQLIAEALHTLDNKISTVVSASAIGWYGADVPGHPAFVETDPADAQFLGETCRLWEAAITPVASMGRRLVIPRIGIVLAKDGGALAEFKKPLQFRVAGVLGNGRQMVSWIHIHDLCRMIIYALYEPSVNGVYNAVAPHPVSNEALTLTLAKAMHGKAFIKMNVPEFVLNTMMGERSVEVLKSTNVSAHKIQSAGFAFQFPTIEKALQDLAGK